MRTFRAKFDGRCRGCGGRFCEGEMIAWEPPKNGQKSGTSYHIDCQPEPTEQQASEPPAVDEVSPERQAFLDFMEQTKDDGSWDNWF